MGYLKDDDIELVIATSNASKWHKHEFLELAYVTKGTVRSIIHNEEHIIKQGDYFIIDYDTMHFYERIGDEPIEITNILFLPQLIDKSLLYCRSFSTLLNHYLINIDAMRLNMRGSNRIFTDHDGKIRAHITTLLEEYHNKKLGFTEIMRCVLIEILILTMRKIYNETFKTTRLEEYVRDCVMQNYISPPTLMAIAEKFNYSIPHTSKRIKELLGVGYREYVTQTRIDEARRLLANTDKKISEIAETVGYHDVNFFYKTFKKYEKLSPASFRKMIKRSKMQ